MKHLWIYCFISLVFLNQYIASDCRAQYWSWNCHDDQTYAVLQLRSESSGQQVTSPSAAKQGKQTESSLQNTRQSAVKSVNNNSVKHIETRVVRVFATRKSNYYHKPWKSPDFSSIRASGFFFKDEKHFPGEKGLILTNAHVVSMGQRIMVSSGKEKRRYLVNVLGICHTADFAVLKMESEILKQYEARNGKVEPFELGDSDKLRIGDKVLGWGYPLGGERISKSEEGEINRIEVSRYSYSHEYWLMIQASLQQNRGNSGGPVLRDEKVVGLAFQGIRTSDRINYFIPINLVRGLMPVLKKEDSTAQWRYVIQHMFGRLKDYYNMSPDDGGVLVDYVIPGGGPDKFGLKAGDILMEIDGHVVDNFGDIFFEPLQQNIAFAEILNRKKVGDNLTLKVKRKGKMMVLQGKVTPGLPRLVPKVFTGANYFIFGGVGFVELTYNCIQNLGKSGTGFRKKYLSSYPEKAYQKIVIISEIFPEYGLEKTGSYKKRVEKINGKEVLNIEHLLDEIQSLKRQGAKKALLEIAGKLQLPIDFSEAEKLDAEIKNKYGILYMKTPGGFSK